MAHKQIAPPLFQPDERYSRQVLFAGIGRVGQQDLATSRIAIVGVGATGAASASLLARAGVGYVKLIDRDFVESSNLQRQVLFDEADAEAVLPKAEAARRKIALFNSAIQVTAEISDLTPANIGALLTGVDLVLDCTDNFETRYLLNDYCVAQGLPWVYAGAIGATAAGMTILPVGSVVAQDVPTACLACLFPAPPAGAVETCDTAGVLGAAVNLAASVQVAETLKLLTGKPELIRRTFFSQDLWSNQRSEVSSAAPDPDCGACGQREFIYLMGSARPHITICGRNSIQIHEHHRILSLELLRSQLMVNPEVEDVRSNSLLLRFRRGSHQITVFADGRALVQGTTDPVIARSLYARFIGC